MPRVALSFVVAISLLSASCSRADSGPLTGATGTIPPRAATAAPAVAATPPEAKAAPRTPAPRVVTEQDHTPFASVGGVALRHPSRRVERVGFHQSNHEGARQLTVAPTAVAPVTLETRDRLTPARTAADVVSDPKVEIRAPVTGRVKRAGSYVLYCKHSDDFLVIEPDAHPGWEVKLLHIDGVLVRSGDRVVAGQTVVAAGPTHLPFESQVDGLSEGDAWPHVHIEVVDPSIPNEPSPGSGC
jgi:murein DD-endopeptidase MepM/ murein hydrolase activator NlpD